MRASNGSGPRSRPRPPLQVAAGLRPAAGECRRAAGGDRRGPAHRAPREAAEELEAAHAESAANSASVAGHSDIIQAPQGLANEGRWPVSRERAAPVPAQKQRQGPQQRLLGGEKVGRGAVILA